MAHKIPLKNFWENVEQRLAVYSADELRSLIRAMARDTAPGERENFLAKLQLPEKVPDIQTVIGQDRLLADIDDLIQELGSETARGGNREYDWYEYDEEDNLGPYLAFIPSLIELFERTRGVFEQGNFQLARDAYERLLAVPELEDDYGRGIRTGDLESDNLDLEETFARYLRSIYETTSLQQRPDAVYWTLKNIAEQHRYRPRVEAMMEVSVNALSQQSQFLEAWIDFLRPLEGAHADAWLREAVRLAHGIQGLADLAANEGQQRPRVYVDWLRAMAREGDYRAVLNTAREALNRLDVQLPIRAAIADQMVSAALTLGDIDALQQGRWEALIAKPSLKRLLELWEATRPRERTLWMQRAVQQLEDYRSRWSSRSGGLDWEMDDLEAPASVTEHLLVHTLLLADEWNKAQQLADARRVLGWSYSDKSQALVVAFTLMRLAEKTPKTLPPNLQQLWHRSAGHGAEWIGYFEPHLSGPTLTEQLDRVYGERLADSALSEAQQSRALSWCLEIAEKRVQAIVSGQHRKSYDKAALLTAACSEMLHARSLYEESQAFINKIRSAYPRHSAFQKELRAVL